MKSKLLLLIVTTLAVCLTVSCTNKEESQIIEVSVYSTPGKPLVLFDPAHPAENITAKRGQNSYILFVGINVPRDGIESYYEREAMLTKREWQSLMELVAEQNLSEFIPQEYQGRVLDFGVQGFVIVTDDEIIQKDWYKPLKNPTAPLRVRQYLVELASQKLPGIALFYLP